MVRSGVGRKPDLELRLKVVDLVNAQGAVSFQRMREICSDEIVKDLVKTGYLKQVRLSFHLRNARHHRFVKTRDVFGSYADKVMFYRSPLKLQLFLFNNLYEITGDQPSPHLVGRLTRFIHDLGYPVMIDTSWTPQKQKKLIRRVLAGKTSESRERKSE